MHRRRKPVERAQGGQDAMADASEVQEAGIARFSEGLLVGSGEEQPAMDNCAMVSTTTPGTASLRRLLSLGDRQSRATVTQAMPDFLMTASLSRARPFPDTQDATAFSEGGRLRPHQLAVS